MATIEVTSAEAGTSIDADVGDTIEWMTPAGPRLYRVAAIGGDYLNAKITTAPG